MKRIIVLSVLLSFALALPMEAQHVDRGVLERKMDEAIAKHRREKAAQQAKEAEQARQVQQSVDNHQRQAREIDSNSGFEPICEEAASDIVGHTTESVHSSEYFGQGAAVFAISCATSYRKSIRRKVREACSFYRCFG